MMSGILPSASNHPVWSPIAGEIHAVIWDRVRLEIVQGFVWEWASNWLKKFNSAESSQQESLARVRQQLHYPDYETLPLIADNLPYDRQMQQAIDAIKDWQPWLPELPLPPSPHRPRSLAEKWASLAALHDVYDLTGDTVLPWTLPKDDLDLIAFAEWIRGEAGAYQLLMRKAFALPQDCEHAIRRWLTDVSKDTPPKKMKSIERMGAKLIELGFPDPRKDHSNWRIIAIMVGADPDGMMDDIFQHAIAHQAKLSMLKVEPAAPAAMAGVEEIRQEALLASLSPKNRLYVFCGRIWSEYRRQQEALILEGRRRRTRGGVLIEEAFSTAKANGWPEDQLDEFTKCAREGIKNGKAWTDFVKGSKGNEILLKKFLT